MHPRRGINRIVEIGDPQTPQHQSLKKDGSRQGHRGKGVSRLVLVLHGFSIEDTMPGKCAAPQT